METNLPYLEQRLFDKLKRKRLCSVLAAITGTHCGQVDVAWNNGSIRNMTADRWITDALNDPLDNPGHVGVVRYHFGNKLDVKLEYLINV